MSAATGVDEQHPWIGLASFTEESRPYFHGREEEIAELARRVQRKLLTVLFGQSGLGKTSILRAGLVPRLRGQGYCPVYVRVDYAADAPEPAEQIKRAIAQTASGSGEWTQAGVASAGETLWEFLHHRDDLLKDEQGATLIPLLIFDQFEEVFTLAQSDEAGRSRAARFLAQLADLVENRPPASFEARLEADDTLAERFDFARSDYRVLLALREDYLAQLEGLKASMPSITQNRLRLAPMNGRQALQAVLLPGGKLVTREVAEAIVRFVAGGAELDTAEVEPSLLSLICRELNDARIARGSDAISQDLLAGSHEQILGNFYERALADQPVVVRRIVEDELLTDSGFRENVAEERLRKSLDAAGAAPGALATLVDRRLLRIEERLDVRRVELTHDVLCGVVKRSRDVRQEREAREAAERRLAEQHAREQASRQALRRAVRIAAVCGVLAMVAVGAALYAWASTKRAHRAEQLAQQSRVQAEALLGYLTTDFAEELSRSGRLDVVVELAKREVEYFQSLPEALKGPESKRLGALALIQQGRAQRSMGLLDEADAATDAALALIGQLRKAGDDSEETLLAEVRALGLKARILSSGEGVGFLQMAERAVELLAPLASRPDASEAVRNLDVEQRVSLGFAYGSSSQNETAVASLKDTMARAERDGGKDPEKNLFMAERYAEAGSWLTSALNSLGRSAEAVQIGRDARQVAEAVLEIRPGNFPALYSLGLLEGSLGAAALDDLRPADALPFYARATGVYTTVSRLDPGNRTYANNRASQYGELSRALWSLGRLEEASQALGVAADATTTVDEGAPTLFLNRLWTHFDLAGQFAERGDFASARRWQQEHQRLAARLVDSLPPGSGASLLADAQVQLIAARFAALQQDWRKSGELASGLVKRLHEAGAVEDGRSSEWSYVRAAAERIVAEAALQLGDFGAAETAARAGLAAAADLPWSPTFSSQERAAMSRLLALALLGQGRDAEAREAISPALLIMRGLQQRNRQDAMVNVEIAKTLYVAALTDPARHDALLREATAMMDAAPASIRGLLDVQLWRGRMAQEAKLRG